MAPELQAFLFAEDLDEVLDARGKITALSAEDTATVRTTLEQWNQPQAISNLLCYPDLIPVDIRLFSLFRGLAERRVAYYVLAALVGLQGIDPKTLSADERVRVLTELWSVMAQTSDVLAQRASVSFGTFADERDAPEIFFLLTLPDKTVRHNLRAWLFRTFKDSGVEAFAHAAKESGLAAQIQHELIHEFTEFLANPPEGFKSPLFPLLAYLPNLRDTEYPR